MAGVDLLKQMESPVFAYFWNDSDTSKQLAKDFGVSDVFVNRLAAQHRAAGANLKKFRRKWEARKLSDAEFASAWNAAERIADVAKDTGMTYKQCQELAFRLRKHGMYVKAFKRGRPKGD